jgi:hypothetical protein
VSAADGHVIGVDKLVDHGDPARRWNLVILAEGYRAPEMPQFRAACAAFIERIYKTKPYGDMWSALNVYCVDIASSESGADNPLTCADGDNGAGTKAKTYFDATYCVNGTGRLLAGNETLALVTAQAAVPQVDATLVSVNHPRYGGAGGGVGWFSSDPAAAQIAIHELGHSAFRLTDEYTDLDDRYTGGEPSAPNASIKTDRATTKWHDLILAGTALPTMTNPDCTTSDNRSLPNGVSAETVGLFEGAARARCRVYRPQHDCYMRTLGTPFCAVCSRTIAGVLQPHLPVALNPGVGLHFTDTVDANGSKILSSENWLACWQVQWTVVPTTKILGGPALEWKVGVERSSREHVTYWIDISNRQADSVPFELRYEIVGRH